MNKHNWRSADHPLQLVAGFIIWSIWFIALYGGFSVGCTFMPPLSTNSFNWLNASLLVFTLVIVALLILLARHCWCNAPVASDIDTTANSRPAGRFIARLAACLYLFAAVATLAVGLPLWVLPPCI